jgi:hypothetical protein
MNTGRKKTKIGTAKVKFLGNVAGYPLKNKIRSTGILMTLNLIYFEH